MIKNGVMLEGTADKVAEQVFKETIAPIFNEMAKRDAESAKIFAFSIVWLSMAQYSCCFSKEGAQKSIRFTVDKFCEQLDGLGGDSE